MRKKYFFFDIDGTLVNNTTGEIVPSAKLTLEKLEKQGHFVSLATGRAHYKARKIMEEMEIQNMVCNGGNGLVVHNTLIENRPLPTKEAIAILQQAESLGYGILIALDDSKTVYSKNDLFIEQVGRRKEPTKYIFDKTIKYDTLTNIYKIYIAIAVEEESKLTLKNTLGSLRFEKEYVMFQPDNKKKGIYQMLEHIGGCAEDVVVFGDDYNDLDMFNENWTKVAMGNACEALKIKADYVTSANIDDGIHIICHKMGWVV